MLKKGSITQRHKICKVNLTKFVEWSYAQIFRVTLVFSVLTAFLGHLSVQSQSSLKNVYETYGYVL
jgi:hypothetical protein